MTIPNLVYKQERECSLVTWMKRRVERHENVNCITIGPTGSGKSYLDNELCRQTDTEFDPSRQIVFTHLQLMKLINDPWFMAKKYKVVNFEELQITQNARTWQSKTNRLLNMLLSTYRHRGIILMVNTPFADYIDKQSLKLFHILIEMRGKDLKRNVVRIRPKILQWSSKKKDFYYHSIYVKYPNGKAIKTPFYSIPKPPKAINEIYEQLKMEFTSKLNAQIQAELEKNDEPEDELEDGEGKPQGELNINSMQPMLWEVAQQGWRTQMELCEKLGEKRHKKVNISQLNQNKQAMKKKGFDIDKFKVIEAKYLRK